MDITLYYAPHTRALRTRWLFEEMGLPYTLERVNFTVPMDPNEPITKVSPFSKVPAAVIDGETIFDSSAIADFVMENSGYSPCGVKPGDAERARFLSFSQVGETIAINISILAANTLFLPEDERSPAAAKRASENLHNAFCTMDAEISDSGYILKSGFSYADIAVFYNVHVCRLVKMPMPAEAKNFAAWVDRIVARPAYQRAAAD